MVGLDIATVALLMKLRDLLNDLLSKEPHADDENDLYSYSDLDPVEPKKRHLRVVK